VLEGALSIVFDPPNPLPNDWIEFESVTPIDGSTDYRFAFSVGAASQTTTRVVELKVVIIANAICLENSTAKRIRE